MIEKYNPFIENKLQSEPWRGSEGTGLLCDGKIEWDGTKYWLCKGCGKVGTATVQIHRKIRRPSRVLAEAVTKVFFGKR